MKKQRTGQYIKKGIQKNNSNKNILNIYIKKKENYETYKRTSIRNR